MSPILFVLASFFAAAQSAPSPPRADYVGDSACRDCHRDKFDSFEHAAHHLTSHSATRDSIAGSFAAPNNVLKTENPDLFFTMEEKGDGFFQTAVTREGNKSTSRTERMDITIGSGRKGQTYLYWHGNALFELPVSYWTDLHAWVNSPGYVDGFADFSRPIPPRCLECHGSYFQSLDADSNRYDRTNSAFGITCEKCHGPGRPHVAHFSAKEESVAPPDSIVNPRKLSRDRQTDLCALCHGGVGQELAPAFSFAVGEPLAKYLTLPEFGPEAHVDVHGSQIELLKRSRCYRESSTMTCSTCHDVHAQQRDAASFSSRCLTCHQPQSCGLFQRLGPSIANNCVDCHMPKQKTDLIVSSANGTSVKPEVRSHWIRIYAESAPPATR